MLDSLKFILIVAVALLLQVTVLPFYLADPFKPDLLIIIVVFLGLRGGVAGGVLAVCLGILHDSFSGIYQGLNGFSYLCIYLFLNITADRLYTDSRYLMVVVVFLATVVNGILHLILLFLFPHTNGIYLSILASLIPQGLVNALAASLIFALPKVTLPEESK